MQYNGGGIQHSALSCDDLPNCLVMANPLRRGNREATAQPPRDQASSDAEQSQFGTIHRRVLGIEPKPKTEKHSKYAGPKRHYRNNAPYKLHHGPTPRLIASRVRSVRFHMPVSRRIKPTGNPARKLVNITHQK